MTLEHPAVRENIINTTMKLLEQGGLDAVKARAVAGAVGVSIGTVYNLFGNVDRLIQEANVRVYDSLSQRGRDSIALIEARYELEVAEGRVADTPRNRVLARLMGLSETYIDFVAANSNRWAALLAYNRSRGAVLNEDTLDHLNALLDIIGVALRDVPRWTGESDRRLAARALWSAVHGIVSTNFFAGDRESARARTLKLIAILVTTLVDGMFAREE